MVRCSDASTESCLRAERIKGNSAVSCRVMYSSRHVPLLSVNSLDSHVFPRCLPPSNSTQHRRSVCSFISGLQSAQVKEAASTHGVINRNSEGRAFFFSSCTDDLSSKQEEVMVLSVNTQVLFWPLQSGLLRRLLILTVTGKKNFPPTKRIGPRNEQQMSINGMSLKIKSCSCNSCTGKSEVCYKDCKVYFYLFKLSLNCKHKNFMSICSLLRFFLNNKRM